MTEQSRRGAVLCVRARNPIQHAETAPKPYETHSKEKTMSEEEKRNDIETKTNQSQEDYIEAIKKLKENSVPKAEYEKKVEENKKLLQTLVEGGQLSQEEAKEAEKTSDDYAKELIRKNHTNLEYAILALKQREKAIEEGKPDPFVPAGLNFQNATAHDGEDAESAAEMLQSCVDDCNGDPEAFRALFQARTKDLPQLKMKQSKKG